MAGQLLLIAFREEVYLVVLLPQGFVEVVDLFNEGLLDQLGQSSHVGNAVFRFVDQLGPRCPCVVFVLYVSVAQLVLETGGQFF